MIKSNFGIGILKIKSIKNYNKIENITTENWIIKNCGKKVYEKIWEPLLISKYADKKSKISMAWLWGKINLRSSSSKLITECLGYMDGSFEVIIQNLEKYLIENGCKIKYNYEVKNIVELNSKWLLDGNTYDAILSTVAYPITKKIYKDYLSNEEIQKMDMVKYTAARTMIITSKKPFTSFYWLNNGDKNIPFGGIIEHTNMVSSSNYNGNNIIYISNYMFQNDKLFKLSKQELYKIYLPYLKKIADNFNSNDIIDYDVYDELYAQPVIETNYSDKILPFKLQRKGLYIATMPQIYPEDRGMNYAIKMGYEVADAIYKELEL